MKTENAELLERKPLGSSIDPEPGEENDTDELENDNLDSDNELTGGDLDNITEEPEDEEEFTVSSDEDDE